MKILVTGAAGMLGSSLCPILESRGHQVIATDINDQEENVKFLDVRETKEVTKFIERGNYDWVIHLAAETNLEKCEADPDNAYMTNSLGVQNVALACQKDNLLMVYISSAGVFDGEKKEPYTELDIPKPINVYGKTKLKGEKIVKKQLRRYFIARAGWMMGGGREKDKKFVMRIVKQIDEGTKVLYAVADKTGAPTYTVDFSQCLSRLITTDYYGTYHLVGRGNASRFDIAQKIIEFLGRRDIKVVPVASEYFKKEFWVPRAKSEKLRNYRLDLRGMNTMRSWQVALKEYLTKL